jgi:Cu/Ag efflux pump CusA
VAGSSERTRALDEKRMQAGAISEAELARAEVAALKTLEEGAELAGERGLRPALMTASVALIGLLPAAVSRGIGSETRKPLAIVVIGGMLVLSVLPRLLLPPLLALAPARRGVPARAAAPEW